jgi:hypothetical protein
MASTPNYPGALRWSVQTFVNADSTGSKTLFTPGSSGSKIVAVTAFSDDTTARDLRLTITRSATVYPLSTISIPIGAGNTNSVPPVAVLQTTQTAGLLTAPTGILPIDQDAQAYMFLQSGDTLTASVLVAVTSTKQITVHVWGCDF